MVPAEHAGGGLVYNDDGFCTNICTNQVSKLNVMEKDDRCCDQLTCVPIQKHYFLPEQKKYRSRAGETLGGALL